MKLANYPERADMILDDNQSKEREVALPVNIAKVKGAMNYFKEMMFASVTRDIDMKEVNPGYIFILDDCITFCKNKEKINEAIQPGLNEKVYEEMTGRRGFHSTIGSAEHLVHAFSDPVLRDTFEKENAAANWFLQRDTREQAYRICDYVMKYMKGYAEDERLSEKTKQDLVKALAA